MTIAGVASALPQHKYDQRVLLQALQKHWGPKVDNPVFLERLQARVGVETRHLALPIEEYYGLTRWGAANNHWIEVAQDLGQKALCCALSRSGFSTEDLGALFFVSVTGISSPSIDARLVNRMNLPGEHQARAHLRPGMRGRSGRHFARRRLRAGLSQASGCGALGGALLAHLAAGRHLHREYYFVGIVRRRRGRGVGVGRRSQGRWPRDPGDALGVLSEFRARHGLGHFRKRLPHCSVARGAGSGARTIWRPMWTRSSKSRACRARTSEPGCCTPAARAFWRPLPRRSSCPKARSPPPGIACAEPEIFRRPRFYSCSKK